MKCPHCNVVVHVNFAEHFVIDAHAKGTEIRWNTQGAVCPACLQAIINLAPRELKRYPGGVTPGTVIVSFGVWPQAGARPVPEEVPEDVAKDFREATAILTLSAQASAALTRRSLQYILREFAKTASKDLYDQIQEVIDEGHIPTSLAKQLDAVRAIGNFAAHPLKSKMTGAILPLEPQEAEWNLDVLEDVFDHYFVKPAQAKARLGALNKKLADAGKPPVR